MFVFLQMEKTKSCQVEKVEPGADIVPAPISALRKT